MDKSYRSYKVVEKQIEAEVRLGRLPREQAQQILQEARMSYRKNNIQRAADMLKERQKCN